MFYRHLPAVLILSLLSLQTLAAQDVNKKDIDLVRAAMLKKIEITPKEIASSAVKKVFKDKIFDVKVTTRIDRNTSTINYKFVLDSGESKSMKKTDILPFLNPAFKINSIDDAEMFQRALDDIFPLSRRNQNEKALRLEGNHWLFIRGSFLKDKSGFIVKTEAGKIIDVKYEMRIHKALESK